MPCGLTEVQAMVDVRGPGVVQSLECMGEELQLASFLDWEPVQLSAVWSDVGRAWVVEDESS